MNKNEDKSIIKSVDHLGRVTLPRELRKLLTIKEGSKVELSVDKDKITISRYSPMTTLREWGNCIISALSSVIEHDIILSDTEKVINSNKKKYLLKIFTSEAEELIYKREITIKKKEEGSNMVNIFDDFDQEYCCELVVPIIKNEDILGAIIVLASENKCFDDDTVKVCRAFASFLSCVIY